ncbi:MAG: DNA-directed RNA polymerase subunit alpha C-terminal domain-containing protein [Acidobacteriota bacterium]
MIRQLRAIVGFEDEQEEEVEEAQRSLEESGEVESGEVPRVTRADAPVSEAFDKEFLKTRVETLDGLSQRTANALSEANIRTVGGLVRKKAEDLLELDGIGERALEEIKDALAKNGVTLK